MDRQSIIGFILMAILFIIWMVYTSVQYQKPVETEQKKYSDSIIAGSGKQIPEKKAKPIEKKDLGGESITNRQTKYGKWFGGLSIGVERNIKIESKKVSAVFTSRGGGIKRWILKGYSTWNRSPLQLIDWKAISEANLFFITKDGKEIHTENFFFDSPDLMDGDSIFIHDTSKLTFRYVLKVIGDSCMIIKEYTIYGNAYHVDLDVRFLNMGEIIANNEYQITIGSPALTELNTVEEAAFSEANAYVDSKRYTLDVTKIGDIEEKSLNGNTNWVAVQNKYFISALLCRDEFRGIGAFLEGVHIPLPFNGSREIYQASMKIHFDERKDETAKLRIFIGPMQYDLLKSEYAGLEQTISLGWKFIVRPFSEYLIIPLFAFLHKFIPNYGLVILVFTIIIKLILYPLTKSSTTSMKKMQALQPLMNDIKTKYKDDPQKQNAEIMRLYKDYGINPAGGCLPLLLQMPILFALFTIFRSTFELRHQPFVLWISDLSSPDILFTLPFKIPILGTNFISLLSVLMAITMYIQQKQTVKDPRQKAMIYIMPLMFWMMFNNFPSGLNLYYFSFNLLSILQQWWISRKKENFQLVKVQKSKKSGVLERAMKSLEEQAKKQKQHP
ncbi:MAG: membrane protein insertase YidC [Bacteroidota bacterium]|nr:membrane protein insertase YidC [Bacteroidota bacterium]